MNKKAFCKHLFSPYCSQNIIKSFYNHFLYPSLVFPNFPLICIHLWSMYYFHQLFMCIDLYKKCLVCIFAYIYKLKTKQKTCVWVFECGEDGQLFVWSSRWLPVKKKKKILRSVRSIKLVFIIQTKNFIIALNKL